MKQAALLLVLTLLVGCQFKKEDKLTDSELFNGVVFNAYGVSKSQVQLGIRSEKTKDNQTVRYLISRPKENQSITKILCTFDSADYPIAQEAKALSNHGLTVVIRDTLLTPEQRDLNPKAEFKNFYFSFKNADELNGKTSADLAVDPDTLVMVRDLDVSDPESAKTVLCEFNLIDAQNAQGQQSLQSTKPSTARQK